MGVKGGVTRVLEERRGWLRSEEKRKRNTTQVAPHDLQLGPQPIALATTVCFQCHDQGHFHVDCPEYECPHCQQSAPGHPQYCCSHNYCSFADTSAISRMSVQTDDALSVMTQGMSSATVLSQRTPVRELSSTRETLRDCDLISEV